MDASSGRERLTLPRLRGPLGVGFIGLLIAALLSTLAACGSGDGDTSGGTVGTETATSDLSGAAHLPTGDAEAVRQLAFDYWDAFNSDEPDRALSYLEPTYRAAREDKIRGEIERLNTFGVQLGVREETPPHATGPDAAEMDIGIDEPLGSRTVVMRFEKAEGQWWIVFAEET